MAGALTHKGVHHTFQGCPASGGWSHSSSTDLVHWTDHGIVLEKANKGKLVRPHTAVRRPAR